VPQSLAQRSHPTFRGARASRAAARADARNSARAARIQARAARLQDRALARQSRQDRINGNRNGGIASFARRGAVGAAAIGAGFAARHAAHAGWYHDWRRNNRHRRAYGWYGPVYWPYAYDSVFADVFYPDADDDSFWDYGYGDIYASMFSPYSYDDLLTTQAPAYERQYAGAPPAGTSETTAAIRQLQPLCGDDSRDVAGVPVDEIQNTINPTGDQTAALDDLGNASVKAAQIVKASCPSDIALTATGRLDNMKQRLEAMIEAVATVRTPLDKLYGTLNDEQKARFNAIGQRDDAKQQTRNGKSLAQNCGAAATAPWPQAQIERNVKPTAAQQKSLDALRNATDEAATQLRSSCQTEPPATPTERLAAIDTRLHAMLDATNRVRKPLGEFYESLNDTQKAQFNAIGHGTGPRAVEKQG
jgi:hypothetical protein